jgi:integrase
VLTAERMSLRCGDQSIARWYRRYLGIDLQRGPITVSPVAHRNHAPSPALALRKRDLIPDRRAVRAPGTKNANRDRVARVRAFAWPAVEAHVKDLLPNAKLFDGVTYAHARTAHVAACRAAEIGGYTLHSARHTFAVQLLQEGVPGALIASNFGHKDNSMVQTCYGRYKVDVDKWAVWEGRIERHAADERVGKRDAK